MKDNPAAVGRGRECEAKSEKLSKSHTQGPATSLGQWRVGRWWVAAMSPEGTLVKNFSCHEVDLGLHSAKKTLENIEISFSWALFGCKCVSIPEWQAGRQG